MNCKECSKEITNRRFDAEYCSDKCGHKFTSRILRRRRKEWFIEQKNKPCIDCKQKFPPYCMDFDHLPGFEKKFDLCFNHLRTLEVVKEEIAKCDVVCAICHRIRTFNRTQYKS